MKTHQPRRRAGAIAVRGVLFGCAIAVFVSYGLLLGWLVDQSLWLGLTAGAIVLVPTLQITLSLVIYTKRDDSEVPDATGEHSVDVFVTVCDEPFALIHSTARAARDMRGDHQTWLLDDADSADTRAIAEELGIGYLARAGNKDFKAGNLNHALKQTSADIIAAFDVDHRPRRDFLERTLGHFRNDNVGFVQASITYRNQEASWTARAAAELGTDYYSLANVGKSGAGAATMMGSNGLIRRRALESIGGYRPGLAEHLETSIALHAQGWESRHVDEPLAPGLAPEDLSAWHTQQKKWARGALHAAAKSFTGSFWQLNWNQRCCYLLRYSYYLTGPLVLLGMLAVTVMAAMAAPVADEALLRMMPILAIAAAGRACASRAWNRPGSDHAQGPWRAAALTIATWPTSCRAWLDALTGKKQHIVATPKQRASHGFFKLVKLQVVPLAALVAVLGFNLAFRTDAIYATPVIHAVAAMFVFAHVALPLSLPQGLLQRRLTELFQKDDQGDGDGESGTKRPMRQADHAVVPGYSHAARVLPTRLQPEFARVHAVNC